jgi:uncharacterized surface protein with fasciclin (FAS1) repeats
MSLPMQVPVRKPSVSSSNSSLSKPSPSASDNLPSISSSDCAGMIIEIAKKVPDLSTFVVLVGQTGLTAKLSGKGPYTVFAPTNDAFVYLNLDVLEYFGQNMHILQDVLLYHVVDEELFADNLKDDVRVTTAEGSKIETELNPVRVNGIFVATTDIEACNGVIHVIDGVLIPPGFSMPGRFYPSSLSMPSSSKAKRSRSTSSRSSYTSMSSSASSVGKVSRYIYFTVNTRNLLTPIPCFPEQKRIEVLKGEQDQSKFRRFSLSTTTIDFI